MNFPSQVFFNDINHDYRAAIFKKNYLWLLPFYMAVATYCYYEKVLRTMRTAIVSYLLNPLSANPTKWSNTLKQFVGKLPTNCLSVFDHFVGLALKGLTVE